MEYDPQVHHRRSIRLRRYDYSRPGAYFVTVCTENKEFVFGDVLEGEMKLDPCGEIVNQVWNCLSQRYGAAHLDAFVVMPNHVHGIIRIVEVRAAHEPPGGGAIDELPLRRRRMLLPKVIGYFKMKTSQRINKMRATPGKPVWQRNYYEHIIRNEGELNKIREYIVTNPLRWLSDLENPDFRS